MSIDITLEAVAADQLDAKSARSRLLAALTDERGHEAAYSALSRWVWRALVERRLDVDLRDWHRLILDVAAVVRRAAEERPADAPSRRRAGLDPASAAERLKGFADLVRESIQAAEASVPEEFTQRAHVAELLDVLATNPGEPCARKALQERTGLKDANLSRLLTLLAANDLVERMPRGKSATFRITQRGLAARGARIDEHRLAAPERIVIAPPSVEPVSELDEMVVNLQRFRIETIRISDDVETFAAPLHLKIRPTQSFGRTNRTLTRGRAKVLEHDYA